jgi:hypothetical protein
MWYLLLRLYVSLILVAYYSYYVHERILKGNTLKNSKSPKHYCFIRRTGTCSGALELHTQYCNGFSQSVSRQSLDKHVPTCNSGRCVSVDEGYSSLLGNSQRTNELAG